MSKHLSSKDDDEHAAGGLSQCSGSSRKRARSAGLAPDQKVQVALPSGLSGLAGLSPPRSPQSDRRDFTIARPK
jgi:hypothetical protein